MKDALVLDLDGDGFGRNFVLGDLIMGYQCLLRGAVEVGFVCKLCGV